MKNKLADLAGRLAALDRYDIPQAQPHEEFESAVDLARSVFSAPMAAISFVDAGRQWLKIGHHPLVLRSGGEMPFCAAALLNYGALAVGDALCDHRFTGYIPSGGQSAIRSYLGAPMTNPDGYNIGTVAVFDTIPRDFSDVDREVMTRIARLTMSNLELRLVAHDDPQTGTVARRAFLEIMGQEIDRHTRYGFPMTLVVFDIDGVSRINAEFGRSAGNEAIAATARAIRPVLRRGDVIGRIGSDEFGILLSGATDSEALQATQRFRDAIAEVRIAAAPDRTLSASFGLVACSRRLHSPASWLAAAQAMVRLAKESGGNCWVVDRSRIAQGRTGAAKLH